MQNVPETVRDALATSYRALPSVADDVRRYAQAALADRKVDDYRTLGLLTSKDVQTVADKTEVNATGYDFALDAYSIKHVQDKHGSMATELPRGQKVITVDDFSKLPEVLNAPDEIIDGGKTEQGRSTLQYVKNIDGSTYHAVFEIRTGQKMLVLLTLWIKS